MEFEYFDELVKLSVEKEIPYTRKQLEKMSVDKLEKIYEEYKKKELDEFNETIVDVTICKLDELMKNREYIKPDSELGKKLQNKKLFRQDLKTVISYVTPVLPFIGFLEGFVTIAVEVVEKYAEDSVKPSGFDNKNVPTNEETDTESNTTETQS